MKGYPGICRDCIYGEKQFYDAPCFWCMDNEDIALHRPNTEMEFTHFTPKDGGGEE